MQLVAYLFFQMQRVVAVAASVTAAVVSVVAVWQRHCVVQKLNLCLWQHVKCIVGGMLGKQAISKCNRRIAHAVHNAWNTLQKKISVTRST